MPISLLSCTDKLIACITACSNLFILQKQTRHIYEILRLRVTDCFDPVQYKAYKVDIKKRLNLPFQVYVLVYDLFLKYKIDQCLFFPAGRLDYYYIFLLQVFACPLDKVSEHWMQWNCIDQEYRRLFNKIPHWCFK